MTVYLRAAVLTLLLAGSVYPPVGGVGLAAVAAVAAIPLVGWELQRTLPIVHPAVLLVVPLFGAFAVVGWLHPPYDVYGADKLATLVTATALSALAAALIRDREHLLVFARVWLASGMLVAAGALIGGAVAGRAVGFGDTNPIWLGRAIASGLVAAVWLASTRRLRWPFAAPCVVLLAAGLLVTGSRGPLVAAGIGILAVFLTTVRARLRLLAGAAFTAVALVAAVLYSPQPESRLAGLADPAAGMRDSGRARLLDATWPVLADRPWGVGWGNWSVHTGIWHLRYPHNLWLEVAVEGGWLVGALVVAVTVWVLGRLWRRRADPFAVLVLGLLACEAVAVSVSGTVNARTFWAMLTVGVCVSGWVRGPRATADGCPRPASAATAAGR